MGITVRANTFRHFGKPVTGNPAYTYYLDGEPIVTKTFEEIYGSGWNAWLEDDELAPIMREARDNGPAFEGIAVFIEDDGSSSIAHLVRLSEFGVYYERETGEEA